MCLYWKNILELQLIILVYVRSIRESNFQLHLAVLRSVMKWFFALDHPNYSRWLSVHLLDLLQLKYNFPQLYNHFNNGQFTFQKTNTEYSNMALDQVHEQNNAQIKGIGGASHLVNLSDESPLVRWELCAGELYKLLFDFENDALSPTSSMIDDPNQIQKHHEDNTSFRNRFVKDVELVIAGFNVNPFEVSEFTPINNTAVQFNDEVRENIKLVPQIGEEQFLKFWNDRLIMAKVPIKKTIKENKFVLPGSSNSQKKAKRDPVLTQSMVSKLRSAHK